MNKTVRTTTINRCPICRVTVTSLGFRWSCDDYHPEVIALLEAKEQDEENEPFGAISQYEDEQSTQDK